MRNFVVVDTVVHAILHTIAIFHGKERLFFDIERDGERIEQGADGGVERQVEKDLEDEKDNHEYKRTECLANGKKTNHADRGKVDACCGLLQSAGIDETFGVDVGIEHEKKVVTVS